MSFDISEIALEIAKKMLLQMKLMKKIKYINSDLFTAISNSNIKFDIIVSNPPYIKNKI